MIHPWLTCCLEQNGKNVQSALRFKEYLRKAKNLSQADIDAVLKKIDELQGVSAFYRDKNGDLQAFFTSETCSNGSAPAALQ